MPAGIAYEHHLGLASTTELRQLQYAAMTCGSLT
jgi:hypothetical protein